MTSRKDWRFLCTRPLILTFLLLSGSCGLIYEIIWMKMLTLVIGNTVFSITTVLSAFMLGLALGSFLAGRFIGRVKEPLRTYGILQGGIGVYVLILSGLVTGTEPLFRFIYQHVSTSFYMISLLRFFICGAILLVPTTLMGATLPVLSKYFVETRNDCGRNIGILYGVNTLGAVLGSFTAGFILIPLLGMSRTIYTAAFLNILIAAAIFLLFKKGPEAEPLERKQRVREKMQKKEAAQEVVPERRRAIAWAVMTGIGLSGGAAMIYQIAWSRVLSLAIGSSVYAFSMILTAFISGLALGSLVIAGFIDRRKDLILGLALVEGAIGISALMIIPILGRLPIIAADVVFESFHAFHYVHWIEFALIFPLLLVPTFMMGMAIPMATTICTTDVRRVGMFFGNVYAMDTLGAVMGSFITGFFLMPWLGAQNSILIAVCMNIAAAVIIFLYAPAISLRKQVAGSLLIILIVALAWQQIPSWDARILTSGPYLYTDRYQDISGKNGAGLEAAMKDGREILFFKEGLHALVSVEKTCDGNLLLQINGKADASSRADAATQLMVGHLPLLLHQEAEDVLVIGLGSGMTLGAVAMHPIKRVDVVEIEPAVVEASDYFRDVIGNALHDPRVRLMIADGRNHLSLTGRQYDVIISEPSNPWVSGMANLFTREFFYLAKQHLRKGGMMCQWVHAYSMSSVDFKTVVRTFHAVFPHVTVWEASFGGDYILIGSLHDLDINYQMLIDRLGDERMKPHMGIMNMRDLAAFMNKLVITDKAVAEYTKGAPLHTDDNARLEYSAPKFLLQGRSTRLLEELYRYRSRPVDMLRSLRWVEIPRWIENDLLQRFEARKEVLSGYISCYSEGPIQYTIKRFEDALAISPKDYEATYLLAKLTYQIGESFKDAGRSNEAAKAYEKGIEAIDNFIRADRALLSHHFDLEAIYAKAHLDLGTMSLKANHLKQAAEAFQRSMSGEVQYAEAHNNLGIVYERMGKYDTAVNQYQLAIDLNPNLVSARMNIANTHLKQEKYREAIQSYRRVQKMRPDLAITNYNLGIAYFKQNQWEKAEKEWKRALELNPDFSEAKSSLVIVQNKLRSD
ncbi:MAG: fused MFS/spermidine synthase [bacterium]